MSGIQRRFGKAVRRLREQAEHSQESFAAAVGVHRTYMGLIERGRVAPTLVVVEKIATALDMSPSGLLAETEEER